MNKLGGFIFFAALVSLLLFTVVTFTEQHPVDVVPESLYGIATSVDDTGTLKEASTITLTKSFEDTYWPWRGAYKLFGIKIGLPTGEHTMECVYPHNAFKPNFVSVTKGWFGIETLKKLEVIKMEASEGDTVMMDYVKTKVKNGNRLDIQVPLGSKNELNCVISNRPFNIKFTPSFQVSEISKTNFPGMICPQETVTLCTQIVDATTAKPLALNGWELLTFFQGERVADFKFTSSLNATCINDVPYGFGGYSFYLSEPKVINGVTEQVLRHKFEYVPEKCDDKIKVVLGYQRTG